MKKQKILVILISLIFILAIPGFFLSADCPGPTQTEIYGHVTDAEEDDSLGGVTVKAIIGDTVIETTETNSVGCYKLETLENNTTYTLYFSKSGYIKKTVSVMVSSPPQLQDVQMNPE
ncbi:MAG: carboxypeptidase regulatory-like domain-containing protein [Candidatus Aminicenantes bacterium]|nr:carboxypeptidase regulatory-like domain-containing protein [Candidatus Aminicenantes bacterium]